MVTLFALTLLFSSFNIERWAVGPVRVSQNQGTTLYLGVSDSIQVWDDETQTMVATYPVPGVVQDIFLDDPFLYVACGKKGVYLYALLPLARLNLWQHWEGEAYSLERVKNLLYMGSREFVYGIDEKGTIVTKASIQGIATDLLWDGQFLWVADMNKGLYFFSGAEEGNLSLQGLVELDPSPVGLVKAGTSLWAYTLYDKAYNIPLRSPLPTLKIVEAGEQIRDLLPIGDHLWVADQYQGIRDLRGDEDAWLSFPLFPTRLIATSGGFWVSGVKGTLGVLDGDATEYTPLLLPAPQLSSIFLDPPFVYAAASEDGVWEIDFTQATKPQANQLTPGNFLDILKVGNYFITAEDSEGMGIYSKDMTLLDRKLTGVNVKKLVYHDPYLFAFLGSSGVALWDFSQKDQPQWLTQVDTPGYAINGYVSGDLLAVADWSGGISLFRLEQNSLTWLQGFSGLGLIRDVVLNPPYLYGLDYHGALHSFQLDPEGNPVAHERMVLEEDPLSIEYWQDHLWISTLKGSLNAYNLKNPLNPEVSQHYDLAASAGDIKASGDTLGIIAGNRGVYLLKNPQPLKALPIMNKPF